MLRVHSVIQSLVTESWGGGGRGTGDAADFH